jgi:chemotaxis-related protein WspD
MKKKEPRSNSHRIPDAASRLFQKVPDKEYIEEWTQSISQPEFPEQALNVLSVLVFRLGKEWLALPTIFCKEITHRRSVHVVPHRSGKILQGVVNLKGELELYVALHELLQIETSIAFQTSRLPYQRNRMMAIIKDGEFWTFPVDEVDGIYKWNLVEIENVPVNVSKSAINYIKGIMKMENRSIGLLDEELLFASLKRSLQ